MNFQAVIFDLDGTLLDTLADIAYSMNHALEQNGFPPLPVEAYRSRVGWGLQVLAERSIPNAEVSPEIVERCHDAMKDHYALHLLDHTVLYPGIRNLLNDLTRAEIPMSVVSNKPIPLALQMVKALLGEWAFTEIHGGSPDVSSKPDPQSSLAAARAMGSSPEQTLFIGDSDVDMVTAVSAGMYPVGVAWGFRSVEELRAAGARDIIEHPRELLRLIDLADSVPIGPVTGLGNKRGTR